jgi:two-component system alkaline phosphatase synthesis response regulator PhoP
MSRRILVVDDDDDIRELARMCLELVGGFTVETADSALTAASVLETRELPDAVLLDVMMPGLDGLSLVRRLRQCESTSTLPVVLLTAKNLPDDIDLDQLGVRGVLGKPFDPMTLHARCAQLLGWPEPSLQ